MVKRDGGPAFFRQDRLGQDARPFKVIKLRSMHVNAEQMVDERGRPTKNRVTPVGKFLRSSSIDELPQLINVMMGEMALIGPRPILPRMLPFMTEREKRRFAVRPGVTGLAQVKGRNYLIWSRRLHYDVIYVQYASFGLDLFIIWRTLQIVVTGSDVAPDANPDQVDDITLRKVSDS